MINNDNKVKYDNNEFRFLLLFAFNLTIIIRKFRVDHQFEMW